MSLRTITRIAVGVLGVALTAIGASMEINGPGGWAAYAVVIAGAALFFGALAGAEGVFASLLGGGGPGPR